MSFCTLNKQRLKLADWLQTTEASLAVLSHLLRVSCDILREAGGVEAKAAFREILPKLLFSLQWPVYQEETFVGSACWSEYSPFHFACDQGAFKKWSIGKLAASAVLDG